MFVRCYVYHVIRVRVRVRVSVRVRVRVRVRFFLCSCVWYPNRSKVRTFAKHH